ncbi:MAG: DUF924 domain-containing protein [Porticoccaceae bacterium]|nr:DUF924 domain-containing protein [Porticoccaceae bacterium]
MESYRAVIDFWFEELSPAQWWRADPAIDQIVAQRFASQHRAAARCELHEWRKQSLGCLAEIIVLDQFSRNLYRDSAQAFAQDSLALALAQQAIALNVQKDLSSQQKAFLYMPFMHSESQYIHELALGLFSERGLEQNLRSEIRHKAIIDRFGHYPHRNKMLGRSSNPEEIEFLNQAGSSF